MDDPATMLTLGIETSCDETSAAVLRGDDELLGHVIHSQDVHRLYGGVVPEIASRAHLRALDRVVETALTEAGVELEEVGLVGVTAGPGLIGALLVGVSWGKGLAWALGVPVIGVHHMEGHLLAPALEHHSGRHSEPTEVSWSDVTPVDILGLEVGYRLIPLVDKNQQGELLGRIKGVRKKLSQEVGFLVPPVHIRDNLELLPNAYRITLMGVSLGEGEVFPDKSLAIDPGQVFGQLQGIKTKDPAFGLDAIWIDEAQKDQAQTLGYTVVDASTVVATHLNQIIQQHTHELLGHEESQKWLELLGEKSPKLVEELVPNTISVNTLLKVLQNLLREQVSIRDMRSIAEALAAHGDKSQDIAALTGQVRIALARQIVQNIVGAEPNIPVITLDPSLEQLLLQSVQQAQKVGADATAFIEPRLAERLSQALGQTGQQQETAGKPVVLLVAAPLRMTMAKFARFSMPQMNVLAYNEVPDNKQITIEATVGGELA